MQHRRAREAALQRAHAHGGAAIEEALEQPQLRLAEARAARVARAARATPARAARGRSQPCGEAVASQRRVGLDGQQELVKGSAASPVRAARLDLDRLVQQLDLACRRAPLELLPQPANRRLIGRLAALVLLARTTAARAASSSRA